MSVNISDLRSTIVPRLDQLNAEMLLGGQEMTITVEAVSPGNEEQPVIIHYPGEDGRPFKPSKTVRKLLVFAWGEDGRQWVGRSMTLYNDESVKFGGMAVGGIRIRALSHIEKEISIMLTSTRGKKAAHTIKVLKAAKPVVLADVLTQIEAASSRTEMEAAKAQAALLPEADFQAAGEAYAARRKVLAAKAAPPPPPASDDTSMPYAAVMDLINKSTTPEALEMAAGFIEGVPADQQQELRDAVEQRQKSITTIN